MILLPIVNIGLVLFVSLACIGLGSIFVTILTQKPVFSTKNISFSFLLGMLITSTLLFTGAAMKTLTPFFFCLLSGFLLFGVVLFFIKLTQALSAKKRNDPRNAPSKKKTSFVTLVALIVLATIFLSALAMALVPPHYKDELVYHLEVPKQILRNHGFVRFDDNLFAYFPMFVEMIYMYFLFLKAPIAAKVMHLVFALLTILGIVALIRKYTSALNALLIAALFASIPTFFQTAGYAYVDIAYLFFLLCAVWAFVDWLEDGNDNVLVMCGLAIAALVGTKYLGLQCLIFFNLALIMTERKSKFALFFRKWVLMNAPVVIFGSLWYVKNMYFTGNPFFPFFYGLFHSDPALHWDDVRAQNFMRMFALYGFDPVRFCTKGATLWDQIVTPFRLSFKARFEDTALYDGMIGPAWILLALTIPFWNARGRAQRFFKYGALFFFIFWMTGSRQVRFFLPCLLLLALAIASAIDRVPWIARKAGIAVMACGIIFNTWIDHGLFKQSTCMDFLSGRTTADDFLLYHVKPFSIFTILNNLPKDETRVFLAGTDNLNFYLEQPYTADYVFASERLRALLEKDALADYIAEEHITHLLVRSKFIWDIDIGLPEAEQLRLKNYLHDHARHLATENGYTLYEIKGTP
jgi:hypothetical protein